MYTGNLQNIHQVSALLNSLSSQNVYDSQKENENEHLREKYFPLTLGVITKFHNNLYHPLHHKTTFSPPAFGITKRPGDFFTPWQCVLAEEAPALATTVFRNAMDQEDFDQVIDEQGKLHKPRTTMSSRRYRPKENPPTALGYLKNNLHSLLDDVRGAESVLDQTSDLAPEYDLSIHSPSYLGVFKDQPCRKSNFIRDPNLVFSPVHNELMEKRLQRFQLEEALLTQAGKLDEIERNRSPVPDWYTIKTPQFFYEARKYNRSLKSRNKRA